jgi:hypothetical protein
MPAKPAPKKKKKRKDPFIPCPYDDHACRVYSFCGTKKCETRGKRLSS